MSDTRAKFTVQEKTETGWNYKYSMTPVVSGSPENETFFKTTPAGVISLQVAKSVGDLFEVGKSYYVDFTEAVEEKK